VHAGELTIRGIGVAGEAVQPDQQGLMILINEGIYPDQPDRVVDGAPVIALGHHPHCCFWLRMARYRYRDGAA
jgi:G:T-mismatch repair DNA endonuclease (very short patch repair protein)